MMPVSDEEIEKAGYVYNSSVNPTWLPGRYNNLHISRTYFKIGKVWQLPASVSPWLRIPLFWLSFHNFPLSFYKYLTKRTYKKDGYVNIYFHPWEFTDLNNKERFGFPGYVSKNTGENMKNRLANLLAWANKNNFKSGSITEFVNQLR